MQRRNPLRTPYKQFSVDSCSLFPCLCVHLRLLRHTGHIFKKLYLHLAFDLLLPLMFATLFLTLFLMFMCVLCTGPNAPSQVPLILLEDVANVYGDVEIDRSKHIHKKRKLAEGREKTMVTLST